MCECVCVNTHTNPSALAGYDTSQLFFKEILTCLNSEFVFYTSCYTKVKKPSLLSYLSIAGGKIFGYIPLTGI